MYALMQAYPFATVITLSCGEPIANHIPLYFVPPSHSPALLQGHVARANPFWHKLPASSDALCIFQGPNAYISPKWYTAKQNTDKRAVPTWNYVAVHAYGRLRIIDDTNWLRTQLEIFSAYFEANASKPWTLSDAPQEYIDTLTKAIVGIEIEITRLECTQKINQNYSVEDRQGVINALNARQHVHDQAMAELMAASLKQAI